MLLALKDNLRINSGTKSKPLEYIVAQQKILMKKEWSIFSSVLAETTFNFDASYTVL